MGITIPQSLSPHAVLQQLNVLSGPELSSYIQELATTLYTTSQSDKDTYLIHTRYIALLEKHIPDAPQRQQVMTEIAKTYIDSPHLLNPALAVLYAHYAMTGETIDPQQLQEKRHEELQSNDPQSFLLALESLEPYYKLLYGLTLHDIQTRYAQYQAEQQYLCYLGGQRRDEATNEKVCSYQFDDPENPISDPRDSLPHREHLLVRICTDTHQKNDHREESTSLFDGDRGDPAFDTDSMLTSPEPGVDYLTVGKVYSHRVDKFPNDPEDTQRWLTHPRKSSAGLYYNLAGLSSFSYSTEQFVSLINDCLTHQARGQAVKALHKLRYMAKEQSLPTYDIIRIADCLRTSAEAFENYERLPAKYETYISLRRHDAIDLYTSLRPNHKTLPHIGTLAQQLSWFLSLDGEINEPAVPHTTITEKNLAACFSEIDAIEEYSFNHEYTLYEYYLELAIYYLTKGELQKALSAYQRGKKRNEKPGYGLYTEQSVQREQEFINYCKRLQYKIYSAYAELTSAISLYMAKENKQDVSDQQHLHACYIIGKRYTQHNQHEYAHEFLSLATYTEDKIIQQEALALLAKEPKVQA